MGHQGRGRDRRRARHRDALGHGAAGRATLRLPGDQRRQARPVHSRIPTTAAKLSCQPTSAPARGFSARVTATASSSAYQRDARPLGERGDQPRAAHHRRTLDRRPGAGHRDVDGDQDQQGQQPRPQGQPQQRQERPGEQAEQQHVLAAHREEVREAGAPEVLAGGAVDAVVLAQHEPAGQSGLALGHTALQAGLGPGADRVDAARRALPARSPGRLDPLGLDRHRDPVPPQAAGPPRLGLGEAGRSTRTIEPISAAHRRSRTRPAPRTRPGACRDRAVD